MKMILPLAVTAAMLTASTVAETDAAAWSNTATYGLGARVVRNHRIAESAIAGNTGHDPQLGDPSYWIDVGPTNRWAMFDPAAGPLTIATNSIAVTITPGVPIDAVGMVDVQASTVRVQVKSGSATLHDETVTLDGASSMAFLDLPAGTSIIVTASGAGEQVAIGKLVMGNAVDLGRTETGPTVALIDYSRRDTDDFGVTTVVERAWSKRIGIRTRLSSDRVDEVQRIVAGARAVPALWIGEEGFDSLTVYGFYKDFSIDLTIGATSYCSLTIEGLPSADLSVPSLDPAIDPPSNFRVLDPMLLSGGGLTSSSIPESDYPEWSAAAVYPAGARVIKAATHRVYESLIRDNSGTDPANDSTAWLDVRSTNRWAMFDSALGSATTATGSIVVVLAPYVPISGLAVLDAAAASVRVQAPGYDRTATLSDEVTTATFLDLAVAVGESVTVTIAAADPADAVAVGTLILGQLQPLGLTQDAPTISVTDYSLKTVDDFGNTSPVERAWAKHMTGGAQVATAALGNLLRRLAALRAKPALWIGDDGFESLTIYGFFKDFTVTLSETTSLASFTIEGLSKAAQLNDPTASELAALWKAVADAQSAAEGALTAGQAAAGLASGKTTLFYQATPPSAAESAPNDQWINTAAGNVALIRVAGSGRLAIGGNAITLGGSYITLPWIEAPDQRIAQALTAAAGAQATADGKVATFNQEAQPTATGVGDLWYQPSSGSLKRWSGSSWEEVSTVGATPEQAAAIAASEAAIEAITSDNVLSRAEKPQFAREYSEAYARYSAITAKAATFGNVAAERAALTSAWNTLSAEVTAITPAYDDSGADSPIVGDDLQAAWNAFYTAYAALDMAITAQTIAVQWSVDGAGGWHDGYAVGDKWQRQSTDGGASWSDPVKVVGEDGADGDQGPQGIPGTPGADGQTHYTWVAYADSADGTVNFTTGNPGARAYLGLAANKTTAVESADPADYVWSKIVGPQGPQGDQGVQGPPGADGTPRYIWVAYADSADGTVNFTTGAPGARTYIGVSPNQTTAVEGTDPAAYNWAKIQGPSGPHTSFVFKRAAAQPATPTAATTPPSGWSDAPPAQTDPATPLWQSQASFQDATRISAWSTPIKLTAASLADLDPAAADLLAEAKAIADGKATIFRQSTPPSAAESQPNDLWINTAAGNRTMVRVAGSGRLAIGGNAITLGGSYITLSWIEAPDAQLGQALASAADAISKAQTAQAAADSAAANIEALSDDGLLTGAEKQQVLIPQDAALDGAWTVLDAQAAGFAITTERTAATASRSAWQTYRNGLSPAWNDTTRATPVDRGTFRVKLDGYDGALRQLQAAISAAAAERAEWDLVSGDKPPSNSDNTAENQHYLGDTPTVVILADYQGTPLAGQLPAEVTVPRYLGSADVTADTDFAITTGSGVTATINNTAGDDQRGTITISDLTTLTGSIYVATSYEGVPLYRQIQIVRQDGNAPTGGGGTAGPVSTSELTSPGTSTTHVPITDVLSLQVGASGALDASASITYHAVTSGTSSDGGLDAPESAMAIKWQYSADGSSGWTDLGAEQIGAGASYWFSIQPPKGAHDDPGSVSLAQSKAGLTAGATAYLRLVGRLADGIGISTVAGTATVAQQ